MKPTRPGEAPGRPRTITTPLSHYNLHPFPTGFNRICETREGGAGGVELDGVQRMEPKGWKVIFLAESLVGILKDRGPRFYPQLPRECLCGPRSD